MMSVSVPLMSGRIQALSKSADAKNSDYGEPNRNRKEKDLNKPVPVNNILATRAEQAIIDSLPVDRRTLRIIGKVLEPQNLKRIGIAAVSGSVLISIVSTLGRDRVNRAGTAAELKKQLKPLQQKLNELEAQNAVLLQQNEDLKLQLAKLEALYSEKNTAPEISVSE